MDQLQSWAKKNTTPQDLFLLEASGNSFQIVRTLAALGRQALVLESCLLGKLKEGHANNDRNSAVRIAKAWLAGTARTVWVPDLKTQERRDWFHAYHKAHKRTTQLKNRLQSTRLHQRDNLGAHTHATSVHITEIPQHFDNVHVEIPGNILRPDRPADPAGCRRHTQIRVVESDPADRPAA